jgi:thiol-disulfide isomerase/thioredoxin
LNTRRLTRLLLESVVVVAIVAGVQAWRARDLLPAGERTAAPPFELEDLGGRTWNAASLAGKTTVLYFFAPWCGVCAASSPQLRWFDRWAGDDVQIVMVALDWSSETELAEYAARHELALPILAGGAQMASDYRVRGYPTYYVIDRSGRIARRDTGYTTAPGLWLRTRGL